MYSYFYYRIWKYRQVYYFFITKRFASFLKYFPPFGLVSSTKAWIWNLEIELRPQSSAHLRVSGPRAMSLPESYQWHSYGGRLTWMYRIGAKSLTWGTAWQNHTPTAWTHFSTAWRWHMAASWKGTETVNNQKSKNWRFTSDSDSARGKCNPSPEKLWGGSRFGLSSISLMDLFFCLLKWLSRLNTSLTSKAQ